MAALDRNYSSPEYNITHDQQYDKVAPTSSALYFAQFCARARMYVSNIIVGVRSVASIAALSVYAGHRISANAAFSIVASSTVAYISGTSVGSYQTIAINRTLAAGEFLGLGFNEPSGKYHVIYEYQILPVTG